jgi:hypothetical protein
MICFAFVIIRRSYLPVNMQQQQQQYSAPQNAGGVSVAVGLQKGPPEKKAFKSESQPKPTTVSSFIYSLLLAIYELNSAKKRSH